MLPTYVQFVSTFLELNQNNFVRVVLLLILIRVVLLLPILTRLFSEEEKGFVCQKLTILVSFYQKVKCIVMNFTLME